MVFLGSAGMMISLHAAHTFVEPPNQLPDLFPVLWSVAGCGLFLLAWISMVWKLYNPQSTVNDLSYTYTERRATSNTTAMGRVRAFLQSHIQSKLDFNDWWEYPQFSTKEGLGRAAWIASLLTLTGSIHLGLFVLITLERCNAIDINLSGGRSFLDENRWILLWQWCAYATSVCCFHLLEFFVTALFNPTQATTDSFLVNHSITYTLAALTSWTEFWLRFLFLPGWNFWWSPWLGLPILCVSQIIRSWGMVTAGESFNHIIQTRRKDNHVLVTRGIYNIFRHPSYVGFFYWSIATQLVLGNTLHFFLATVMSWGFFNRRIAYEEESLCHHFPDDYPSYVARTYMGIPFIKSVTATAKLETDKRADKRD